MEQLFISLAYKYVVMALMMAEVNDGMGRLDLPTWQPICATNVVQCHVSPPRLSLGGSIDTSDYTFGFGDQGRLQFITSLKFTTKGSVTERHDQWASMLSMVDTNTAYALARKWIEELGINIAALERVHLPRVYQRFYHPDGPATERKVMLPRFEVEWGTPSGNPPVWVSVFGPTKEPIQILINDAGASFSTRSNGLVRDVKKLLAISDPEFREYSLVQKSNLILWAATHEYARVELPEALFSGRLPAQAVEAVRRQVGGHNPEISIGVVGSRAERLHSNKPPETLLIHVPPMARIPSQTNGALGKSSNEQP